MKCRSSKQISTKSKGKIYVYQKLPGQIVIAVIMLGLLSFLSLETKAQGAPAKHVLVISLDGLDARYLNNADEYKLRIPALRRLMANGVTARGLTSVYPSITYRGYLPNPSKRRNNSV